MDDFLTHIKSALEEGSPSSFIRAILLEIITVQHQNKFAGWKPQDVIALTVIWKELYETESSSEGGEIDDLFSGE